MENTMENRYGILSIQDASQTEDSDLERAMAGYPASLCAEVKEAFVAANTGDYKKSEKICLRLLDQKAVPEIQMLLGTDYFLQGHVHAAEQVYHDLILDYPDCEEYHVYHGIACHALGQFEEAAEELGALYPLKEYRPFYYTSYGDSLQELGKLEQSREAFYQDVAFYDETGEILSEEMLDGAFENLLHLDVELGNRHYPDDIQLYYRFLDQVEMTDKMQTYLRETIVYMCELMRIKWYRPLFLEFVTHIKEKGYLKKEETIRTLESAFATWESWEYHDDSRICSLVEMFLSANYRKAYSIDEFSTEEEIQMNQAETLSYAVYMCRYVPEDREIVGYIRETYPHTWTFVGDFLQQILADAQGTEKTSTEALYAYTKNLPHNKKLTRKEFEDSLNRAYKRAAADKKEPVFVYDGDKPYRKIQAKVGRNDPCPCGSGKKYKKCCGR
ncbi:MAG: SEC-C domain-containing protein [Lachnospiraceae bacterium]|nr:SEC-C domain-containing protein [Lachnospiraceae bacterium]